MPKKKIRIRFFCDMDGVVCLFNKNASMEDLGSPGYFRNLAPIFAMIEAIKLLSYDYEVFILSHVMSDIAEYDKQAWCDEYMPFIDREHRIFVPYGKDKYLAIMERCELSGDVVDVLIDDFTKNLKAWQGIGIKVLNDINSTKRTWDGLVVNAKATYAEIAAGLRAVEFLVGRSA